MISRRRFVAGASTGLLLGGCDRLNNSPQFRSVLRSAEGLNMRAQRLVSARDALAREYGEADMSPIFRSNGTANPNTPEYARHLAENFTNWRLVVDGLVARPLSIPLHVLKSIPHRVQITRHDCVEGWSAIGQWQGARLSALLDVVQPARNARYVVFHCADPMEEGRTAPYYESIGMDDAYHVQTILAYALNGAPLPIKNGAPIRLRVERQLGYKHAKYVMRLELVDSFAHIGDGKGGYWEDQGYQWYAGI